MAGSGNSIYRIHTYFGAGRFSPRIAAGKDAPASIKILMADNMKPTSSSRFFSLSLTPAIRGILGGFFLHFFSAAVLVTWRALSEWLGIFRRRKGKA